MWHPHKPTVKKLKEEIAALKQAARERSVAAADTGIAGQLAIQDMIKNPGLYEDHIRSLEVELKAMGLSSS